MDIDSHWLIPASKSGPFMFLYIFKQLICIVVTITIQISKIVSIFAETTISYFIFCKRDGVTLVMLIRKVRGSNFYQDTRSSDVIYRFSEPF
jgi:hypothetical protein